MGNLVYIFSTSAIISDAIPVVLLLFIKSTPSSSKNWISAFLIIALITDIFAILHKVLMLGSNLYLLHIYTLVETFLLVGFFYSYFRGRSIRITAIFAGIAILLVELIQQPWGPYLWQMNPITRSLESLFVIFFSLLYFYQVLTEMKVQELSRDLMFWISTAFLLYFGGNFILFLLSDQLVRNTPAITGNQVFVLHSILQITLNTLLSIGIWRTRSSR